MVAPVELIVDDEIVLRLYTLEDVDVIFDLIDRNRDHLNQFGEGTSDKYLTRESVVESLVDPPKPEKLRYGIWVNDTYVGTVNLTPYAIKQAEVGCYLGQEFQRHGYMTRSVNCLVDSAINEMGFEFGVVAEVHIDNTASRSVLERCGFHQLTNGEVLEHLFYGKGELPLGE